MPTVNDLLDPGRVLELVKRWQSTVAGFVAREKEHTERRNERRINLRRALSQSEEQARAEMGARLAGLRQAQEEERQQAEVESGRRRQRIGDALRGSRRQLAARVQQQRDSLIGETQAGILRNKEERKRELARRREENRQFEESLAADLADLGGLEKKLRRAAFGFRWLIGGLLAGRGMEVPQPADASRPHEELRSEMRRQLEPLADGIAGFGRRPPAVIFRFLPPEVLLPLLVVGTVVWVIRGAAWATAGTALGVAAGVLLVVFLAAFLTVRRELRELAGALHTARCLGSAAAESSRARVSGLKRQIEKESAELTEGLSETFRLSDSEADKLLRDGQRMIEEKHRRVLGRAAALHRRRLERLAERHAAQEQELRDQGAEEEARRKADYQAKVAAVDEECAQAVGEMLDEWRAEALPVDRELRELAPVAARLAPEWTRELCDGWQSPSEAALTIPIGRIELAGGTLAGGLPDDGRLAFAGPAEFEVPLALGLSAARLADDRERGRTRRRGGCGAQQHRAAPAGVAAGRDGRPSRSSTRSASGRTSPA